jgi:hypothetical protein
MIKEFEIWANEIPNSLKQLSYACTIKTEENCYTRLCMENNCKKYKITIEEIK